MSESTIPGRDEAIAMARASVTYYREQRANPDYIWDFDAFLHHADRLAATVEQLLAAIGETGA